MTNPKCPECGIEIDDHPAGRCLDTWVAEVVMGWEIHYIEHNSGLVSSGEYCWLLPDGGMQAEPYVFPYSSDIDAAWEVVEHLTNNGYCPAILFDDNGHWAMSTDGSQSVPMSSDTEDISTMFFVKKNEWANSAPLAICRASIKVVSGD